MYYSSSNSITIIGSGLGGCFLAFLLAKEGYRVEMYEKLTKKEICDTNARRSVSMTLYGYGIEMLKKIGFWKYIKPHLVPLEGSYTQVSKDLSPIFSSINHKEMPYYCISRSQFVSIFLEELTKVKNIKVHYQTNVLTIDKYQRTMIIQNTRTNKISVIKPDVIIGADGANSQVRSSIQYAHNAHHSQEYANWTYKQIIIPASWVQKLRFKTNYAYTWSRKTASIVGFPNKNGSIAALLILPTNGTGFKHLTTKVAIAKFIEKDFPMLSPLSNEIAKDLLKNPEGKFVTIHTDPWYYKDFMAIIGDAAHGFYPFFGQGVSAAFGDSVQLVTLLKKYGPQWDIIFPQYQKARKPNMDALGEVSKNEIQRYLRHKRADYKTVYETLESLGHSMFPQFIKPPLADMVVLDPESTASHIKKYIKQKRIARFFGIPLVIGLVTGFVAIQEFLQKKYLKV